MTEEIKEILDKFSNRKQATLLQAIRELKEQDVKHACVTTEENINKLLNYITNLQKENEELKEENKHIFAKVNDDELLISNAMNYAELQNYKSRNEKAVEYIKNRSFDEVSISPFDIDFNCKENLLNILQGGDE